MLPRSCSDGGAPSPGGGKGRGGTGMRSAQELASACTGAAVEEVELLRVVEANARDGMGGSRGESSSAPPPPPRSRVLRQGGLEEEYAKNSPSPLGFAPRLIRHDRQTSYELASTSRPPAPEVSALCVLGILIELQLCYCLLVRFCLCWVVSLFFLSCSFAVRNYYGKPIALISEPLSIIMVQERAAVQLSCLYNLIETIKLVKLSCAS